MKFPLTSAALIALAAPAGAASISVSDFSAETYAKAVQGFGDVYVENFENEFERAVADGTMTNVGRFYSLGGQGTGGTVTDEVFGNDGTRVTFRDGNVYGRTSTTRELTGNPDDDMFLDSNDTYGIRWDISIGDSMFNRVVLTLTDAADVGATLFIMAEGMSMALSNLEDGVSKLVEIDFGASIKKATLYFANYRDDKPMLNDGFSLDDITVNEVPLPASSLLLLGGLGGLAAMRRRRDKS